MTEMRPSVTQLPPIKKKKKKEIYHLSKTHWGNLVSRFLVLLPWFLYKDWTALQLYSL